MHGCSSVVKPARQVCLHRLTTTGCDKCGLMPSIPCWRRIVAFAAIVFLAAPAQAALNFGGDFTLTDVDGNAYSLQDARGKVVLLYFGYASCGDVCPITLAKASTALRELGSLAQQVQTLFVTVDPARDTSVVLREYCKSFHPSIKCLTGSPEQVTGVAKLYRTNVHVRAPDPSGFYSIDHSSHLFAIGRDGRLENIIGFWESAEAIAATVKYLLRNKSGASHE